MCPSNAAYMPHNTTFVDLTKAFGTVNCDGLWRIMHKFGCPNKFINFVKQFHEGILDRVQDDGEFSQPFPVKNGFKQMCVMAPTLFSIMFSAMLPGAFCDNNIGIVFWYQFDGKLFNLLDCKQKPKSTLMSCRTFLFADDCAFNANTKSKMQDSFKLLSTACKDFGLTINTKKTEFMYQPAPTVPYIEPTITEGCAKLAVADKFTYLGSSLSWTVTISDEVNYRITNASVAFCKLQASVWKRRGNR